MQTIEEMTIKEYSWRIEAFNLSRIDQEYDMHMQAWLNHQATATKSKGKKTVSVYKSFKDFFDYEKRLLEVKGKKAEPIDRRKQILLKANS